MDSQLSRIRVTSEPIYKGAPVRKWAQAVIDKYKGLREAGRELNIDFQRIGDMRDPEKCQKQMQLFRRLAKMRRALKKSLSEFYGEIEREAELEKDDDE